MPSQILTEPDGRIAVSFLNTYPVEAPLVIKARPLPEPAAPGTTKPGGGERPAAAPARPAASAPPAGPSFAARLSERAHQDREIVYFLQQPDTHAFALYHDYTETRPGLFWAEGRMRARYGAVALEAGRIGLRRTAS